MKNIQLKIWVGLGQAGHKIEMKVRRVLLEERGDVPGWVLITVMTAGLVVGIWSIAGPQLKTVLSNALRAVIAP